MLQSDDCTLSDFFGYWMRIRMKIEKSDHILKTNILSEMDRRERALTSSPTILGAVYLDPRYQRFLKRDQKETAIAFLVGVDRKILSVRINSSNSQHQQPENDQTCDASDSLEELLAHYGEESVTGPSDQNRRDSIDILLREFDGQREPLITPVLEFWRNNKSSMHELFELSQAVFAIPPTQTSVERAFSSIPIVLTSQRTRLSDKSLQNILLIRANKKYSSDIV